MARKVTPAQYRQLVRQQQAANKRAVAKVNNAIKKHNRDVKRAVDDYNREVRAHNNRARSNRQRLQREVNRLNSQTSAHRYVTVRASTARLHQTYQRLDSETDLEGWTERENVLADLAEAETANSVHTANALEGNAVDEAPGLESTGLTDELSSLSSDLHNRWVGALFALNPNNPDAARHFCTSSREVVIQLIDLNAPDDVVLLANPGCLKHEGKPARRAKIEYLLNRAGSMRPPLADFVDDDVNDVLDLFKVFNSGTHGDAGKIGLSALRSLKTRVEGAVRFLSALARPS